ncbi:MAG: glycosyltransferase [Rhodospirillaceae bacterium]
MTLFLLITSSLSLVVWLYLVLFHGKFWYCDQRLDQDAGPPPAVWPEVVAIVPARNEASVIGDSLRSLIAQDYPGRFRIVLVDDHSDDSTRSIAEQTAEQTAAAELLTVIGAHPLPPGWSGKLWAVAEGVRQAADLVPMARYILLTDADIRHDSGSIRRLVTKAEAERLDLVSLMVLLDHDGFWAGLLIPAFVFFFQKLYPFSRVNDHNNPMAAAAGGCILVRADALAAAGGIASIHGALIDDCALGAAIKSKSGPGTGRLWLGLTTRLVSLRPYTRFSEIWNMVARTAYTQLNHSPLMLAGTLLGMALTYLVAPVAVLAMSAGSSEIAGALGVLIWSLIAFAYRPTLRLYNKSPLAALLLPMVGFLYSMMTVASAVRHWRGRGGLWKGRVYREAPEGGGVTEGGAAE